MTGKTSGDSSPGVSHDIFLRIQDSFTTQGLPPLWPVGDLAPSLACEIGPGLETLTGRRVKVV
jgi:hypothetical protein